MSITIKDIAKMAGVSPTTVSNVINGRAAKATDETKSKIMAIVEEYNYKPNAMARSLVYGKSNIIGVILPDISNPYFSHLVSGIEECASNRGYSILICNTYDKIEKEKKYIDVMRQHCVEGIIFTSSSIKETEQIEELVKIKYPMVMIDRRYDSLGDTFSVSVDNTHSGYMATKHLIELGHKNIGCIMGQEWSVNSMDRLDGYKRAMSEYNLKVKDEWVYFGKYNIQTGENGAKQLIEQGEVTGIIAGGDIIAYGVYKAANTLGKEIPKNISVIGVDDILFSDIIKPRLTTMKQPIDEMATQAMKLLFNIIDNKKIRKRNYIYKSDMIIRESTAKI